MLAILSYGCCDVSPYKSDRHLPHGFPLLFRIDGSVCLIDFNCGASFDCPRYCSTLQPENGVTAVFRRRLY